MNIKVTVALPEAKIPATYSVSEIVKTPGIFVIANSERYQSLRFVTLRPDFSLVVELVDNSITPFHISSWAGYDFIKSNETLTFSLSN